MVDYNSTIPGPIRTEIQTWLKDVEEEEQVRIFYACESGSRVWGFPSANSDYDVRFLYVHPLERISSLHVEHHIPKPSIETLNIFFSPDDQRALDLRVSPSAGQV